VIVEAGQILGKLTSNGKYVAFSPTATDGSKKVVAIAYDNVDASTQDKVLVVTIRHSAVKASELIWPETISEADKATAIADLAKSNIIIR